MPARIDHCLDAGRNGAAREPFKRQKQQFAAVQPRDGQQVEDAQVDRDDERGQAEHVLPAVLHGLADRADDADWPRQLVDPDAAGEHIGKAAQDRTGIVGEIARRPPRDRMRRAGDAVDLKIEHQRIGSVFCGGGIETDRRQVNKLAAAQHRHRGGVVSERAGVHRRYPPPQSRYGRSLPAPRPPPANRWRRCWGFRR